MSIRESHILKDAVKVTEIAPASVNTEELVDSAVKTAKITDSAATTAKLDDDAVTAAKLAAVKFGTVSIDLPSIAATTTTNVDVTVTGLVAGDKVIASCLGALEHGLVCIAVSVPTDSTLRVRITNWSSAAVNGVSLNWLWVLFK